MPGEPIAQDSQNEKNFMANSEIAYSLGNFLGKLRNTKVDVVGDLSKSTAIKPSEFPNVLAETMIQLSRFKHAVNNDEVQENLKQILEQIKKMPIPQNIGFIMPDLWPSQFLMEEGKVAALIDIESYVTGPVELELAVLALVGRF